MEQLGAAKSAFGAAVKSSVGVLDSQQNSVAGSTQTNANELAILPSPATDSKPEPNATSGVQIADDVVRIALSEAPVSLPGMIWGFPKMRGTEKGVYSRGFIRIREKKMESTI